MVPEPFGFVAAPGHQRHEDAGAGSLLAAAVSVRARSVQDALSVGAGEAAISISGDPAQPEPLVHTIRAVGLATEPLLPRERARGSPCAVLTAAPWPVDERQSADV